MLWFISIRYLFLYSLYNLQAIFSQLFLPIFFTLVALIISEISPLPGNSPPRQLTNLVTNYMQNTILYNTETGSPGSANYMPNNTITTMLGQSLVSYVASFGEHQATLNIPDYLPNGQSYDQFQEYTLFIAGNSSDSQAVYNRHYPVSINIAPTPWGTAAVIAFFNGQAYHSVVEAYTTATNMIYSAYTNGGVISITNSPLPRSDVWR